MARDRFTVAIIVGAIGAAQTRAWLMVPIAVALGFTLGAIWADWRTTSDVNVGIFEKLVSAVAMMGRA